eukprot:1981665-Alexandrium_andersonii.AAC.1
MGKTRKGVSMASGGDPQPKVKAKAKAKKNAGFDQKHENMLARFRYALNREKSEIRGDYKKKHSKERAEFRKNWEKFGNFDFV